MLGSSNETIKLDYLQQDTGQHLSSISYAEKNENEPSITA